MHIAMKFTHLFRSVNYKWPLSISMSVYQRVVDTVSGFISGQKLLSVQVDDLSVTYSGVIPHIFQRSPRYIPIFPRFPMFFISVF